MWRRLDDRLPAPRWLGGIGVRTFLPAAAAAVHALLEEAFAWDGAFEPVGAEAWSERMTGDSEFDQELWWLASRGVALVGCALHWSSGWLKDLAVRPGERRAGLGEALVLHGLSECSRRGLERVGLKVDAANPTGAVCLYERLDFVTARRDTTWVIRV